MAQPLRTRLKNNGEMVVETTTAAHAGEFVVDALLNDIQLPYGLLAQTTFSSLSEFRSQNSVPDGTYFRITGLPGEYLYVTGSGAGWAPDDDTLLKLDAVATGSNGRGFSTRASEHASTFAAARAMKGLLGRAKHVHVESHTTFGDGGGGIFDVKPVGSYVDNNGTVLIAGDAALMRRDAGTGPVPAEWFGVQYDATISGAGTDSTDELFAALAFANGLASGSIFESGEGDHSYSSTGRRNRPVRISGPCRVTRKIPVRWRGVQIIGDLTGTDDNQTKSSCIFVDHDDMGIECWTGDNAYVPGHTEYVLAPSLSLEGLGVIRTTAHRAACLDGVSVDGANWFMGLRVWNCSISGHRNGAKVQATYYITGSKIISNIILGGRAYFEDNRERGVDIQVYCQLSDIRNFSCWHNTVGGIRIWADASVVESIDLEGGGDANELVLTRARSGSFYTEATIPGTSGFISLLDCVSSYAGGISTKITDLIGYRVEGGKSNVVHDALPVRPIGCSDLDSSRGYYPPQSPTDDGQGGFAHTLEASAYLGKLTALPDTTDAVLLTHPALYNDVAVFDGVRLPAHTVGTVGVPVSAASIGVLSRTFTAGKIYLVAYGVKYAHAQQHARLTHGAHLVLDEGAGTQVTPYALSYTASRLLAGDTVQVVGLFAPATTTASAKLYVYPYGPDGDANPDYGACVSEVYTAEITAGKTLPMFHLPTLLRGAPFVDSVALNGATPVTLADTGVKTTSNVRTERTIISGTMGAYGISLTTGVGYTLTGTAGDTSTITVSRDC